MLSNLGFYVSEKTLPKGVAKALSCKAKTQKKKNEDFNVEGKTVVYRIGRVLGLAREIRDSVSGHNKPANHDRDDSTQASELSEQVSAPRHHHHRPELVVRVLSLGNLDIFEKQRSNHPKNYPHDQTAEQQPYKIRWHHRVVDPYIFDETGRYHCPNLALSHAEVHYLNTMRETASFMKLSPKMMEFRFSSTLRSLNTESTATGSVAA